MLRLYNRLRPDSFIVFKSDLKLRFVYVSILLECTRYLECSNDKAEFPSEIKPGNSRNVIKYNST